MDPGGSPRYDGAVDEHVARNRRHWDRISRGYARAHARQFDPLRPAWGAWSLPEAEVGALGEVAGREVLELGCGGGHWAVGLARLGARVTGLDVSPAQLAAARALAARHHAEVRWVEADAEALPFGPASFDLVFADHGAFTFCDPDRLLPEAARVLRAGGACVFNMTTPWLDASWDGTRVADRLHVPYFELGRQESPEEVSFQRPYGAWIRSFVRAGFVVEDLVELRPPPGAGTTFENFASLRQARHWPAEHIWKLRRR